MGTFKIPSMSKTRDFIVAVGKALFPDRNFASRRSFHGRRATYFAAAVTQLHAHVDTAQKDSFPTTAGDGRPINGWGGLVGIARKGATPARKSAAGRVRGSVASVANVGELLVEPASGLQFMLGNTATIPVGGFFDADIVGVDTGSKTRLEAGTTLNFVNTISGIETQVVLQKDLDEDGEDDEGFGAYRARVLATFSTPSTGGRDEDYVAWALQVPNIATAFPYHNRAGIGSVDVVAFYSGSGSARILTSGDRAAVLAYIQTKAPQYIAGTGGPLRVLVTVADPQSVEIAVTPNDAPSAFHWDDTTPPTVIGWNGSTRELQFSGGALPPTLKAGHQIILKGVASVQDGSQFKAETISAVDKVILEKAPTNAPAATDIIYSGGPLVDPIRSAILAHLNGEAVYAGKNLTPAAASSLTSTIGLEVLANGIGSANPGGVYGSWVGGIYLDTIRKIAMYKGGVRKLTVIAPVADYEATNDAIPNDTQIHFVTPASVIVRRG